MSLSEYHDRLLFCGMGWLGYTEQVTLDTSIPALEGALDALIEFEAIRTRGQFAPAPPPPTSESIFGAFRAAAAPVRS